MPLEGQLVILREERADDLPFLLALRNDMDTQAWSLALPLDYTLAMYRKRFEGREFSYSRTDARYVIEEKATGKPAGTILYSDLEPRFAATLGIAIARPFWGTGMAYDAQETILRSLFLELGLRVVRLYTHSGNPRAVGLAEKSGFRVSVRMRQAVFIGGKLYDNLMMDLLREEYFAARRELKDRLPPI